MCVCERDRERAIELTSNREGNTGADERRREKERVREEEKDQHTRRAIVFEIVHDRAAPSRTQAHPALFCV